MDYSKRNEKQSKLIILILSIMLLITLAINITMAFFTDSKKSEIIFTLGKIRVEATIVEADGLLPDGITPGDEINRTLRITIPTISEDAYVRVWYEFFINNSKTDLVTLNFDNSANKDKWLVGTNSTTNSTTFYYNTYIAKGETVDTTITFTISANIDESFDGANLTSRIYVEALQQRNSPTDWNGQAPSGWPAN